jgi:enamine deaminase RidA (YjgF/YER057c/UK114 family)
LRASIVCSGEAGSDCSRMLSAMVHLKAIDDFAMMNGVWEAWLLPGSAPARTTVEAKLASPEPLVEVTVIATASNCG